MVDFLRAPITALVLSLVIAGSVPFGWAGNERVGITLLVLAGMVAILGAAEWLWRRHKGKALDAPPPPVLTNFPNNQGVVSVGQSGGITAGTINIGRKSRTFGGSIPVSIVERLKRFKDTQFMITTVMGGADSVSFADEIKQVLLASEWKSWGESSGMMVPPPRGLSIAAMGVTLPAAQELSACLHELGFDARTGSPAARRSIGPGAAAIVEITVGL